MKATHITIRFWTYEHTGVRLTTDVFVHYADGTGSNQMVRFQPAPYADDAQAIADAKALASVLGLTLEVSNTVIPLSAAEKALIEKGEAA